MSSYEIIASSYHEAGHAVTALRIGSRVAEIARTDGARRGFVLHDPGPQTTLVELLAVVAGGPIAEECATGLSYWRNTGDAKRWEEIAARLDSYHRAAMEEKARLKAARLVTENWDLIKTVAQRLEQRGRLVGDELDELLRQEPTAPAPTIAHASTRAAGGSAAIMRRPRPFIAIDLAPIMRRPRQRPWWLEGGR